MNNSNLLFVLAVILIGIAAVAMIDTTGGAFLKKAILNYDQVTADDKNAPRKNS